MMMMMMMGWRMVKLVSVVMVIMVAIRCGIMLISSCKQFTVNGQAPLQTMQYVSRSSGISWKSGAIACSQKKE